MKGLFLLLFLSFSLLLSAQQQLEQTVRGVVIEKNTQESLPGAAIVVSSGGKEFGVVTNDKGEFSVSNIPVGRCNIAVSMLGFTPYVSNNVLIYSGKETFWKLFWKKIPLFWKKLLLLPKWIRNNP